LSFAVRVKLNVVIIQDRPGHAIIASEAATAFQLPLAFPAAGWFHEQKRFREEYNFPGFRSARRSSLSFAKSWV
jgi:hypothetical protein